MCFFLMLLVSCASSKDSSIEEEFKNYTSLERSNASSLRVAREDFTVVERSEKERPSWISHPQKNAIVALGKKGKSPKSKDQFFYSYETTPKLSREIACNIARAFTREDMANFVVEFYREGETDRAWDEYLITQGHDQLLEFFKGTVLSRTYWEHRVYGPQLGNSGKTDAYTCALLVQVDQKKLSQAIEKIQKAIIKHLNYSDPLDIKIVTQVFNPESFLSFYQMNY